MTIDNPNTMKVLITGGGGFLGSRLARTILRRGHLSGRPLRELVLADLVPPPPDVARDERVRASTGALIDQAKNLGRKTSTWSFISPRRFPQSARPTSISVYAQISILREPSSMPCVQRARRVWSSPVRWRSSAAMSICPLPRVIHDDTLPVPQSSYGIQKFMCEQLVADYTRRGLIDGRSVRLMTVTVRPGRPNAAASGFLSSIVREPLNGQPAVCPVPLQTAVAVASPQRAIEGLLAAAEATPDAWGGATAVNLPGLTVRVSEMLDALEVVAGRAARERVRFEEDATIARHGGRVAFRLRKRAGAQPGPDGGS